MFKKKKNSLIRIKANTVKKASSSILTIIILCSALLSSSTVLASTQGRGKIPQVTQYAPERVQLQAGSAFRPVSRAMWSRPEGGSVQRQLASVNPLSGEYIYPGSVVLVLFVFALVLTSLVAAMRQRQLIRATMLAAQARRHVKPARRQTVKPKVQPVKMPETLVANLKPVSVAPSPSLSIASQPPTSAQPVRIQVRRQPCSLEQFTQIEHLLDVAVARMLAQKFEIASHDWDLIRDFWNQKTTTEGSSSALASPRMPFEPASIDDYVEIQMAVTSTTKEALEKLFNLGESDWLKMKLYWYQQFPKDSTLASKYQMSRAKFRFTMNAVAA